MRPLLALALLALSPPALAQSFYLQSGALRVGDARVGQAVAAPVSVVGGLGAVAELAHDDALLSVRASVDLTEAHLQAGVGARTPLVGAAFAVTMLAGTWAPVLAVAPAGVRVALPRGAPVPSALLGRGATAARGVPGGLPWAWTAARFVDEGALHCAGFSLMSRPGAGRRWSPDDASARHRTATARGWDEVEVRVGGFVVVGYRPARAHCGPRPAPSGFGATGGAGAGDGVGRGRVVILPAGTALFARPTDPTPFAVLRAQTYGIEPLDRLPGRRCDGHGRCERMPPTPAGAAFWRVQAGDAGGARWMLQGQVRAPAETLADAPPGHGSYGLVSPWAPDWPRASSAAHAPGARSTVLPAGRLTRASGRRIPLRPT